MLSLWLSFTLSFYLVKFLVKTLAFNLTLSHSWWYFLKVYWKFCIHYQQMKISSSLRINFDYFKNMLPPFINLNFQINHFFFFNLISIKKFNFYGIYFDCRYEYITYYIYFHTIRILLLLQHKCLKETTNIV